VKQHWELPARARAFVDNPPRAGAGVHAYLFGAALRMHGYFSESEVARILAGKVADCGRAVPEAEIRDAINAADRAAGSPSKPPAPAGLPAPRAPRKPAWPPVNKGLRAHVTAGKGGLAELWEESPIRMDESRPRCEDFIDALFPGDGLLCCGASQGEFATRPRPAWRGHLAGLQFIVPAPMTALTGARKSDGKQSAHTLANTGPRKFIVIEQDQGSEDEQAAVLLHLAEEAPLALVVHSGGKSLHGWFPVHGLTEPQQRDFMQYAVQLGADEATYRGSQFVRMPDGQRDNGRRQQPYFWNPACL
jgi:hypothetical protein